MDKVGIIMACCTLFLVMLLSVAITASYYKTEICESKGGVYLPNDSVCIKQSFIIKGE